MKTNDIMQRAKAGVTTMALLGLCLTATGDSDQRINAPLAMPVAIEGTIAIDCSNSPGPQVTLSGDLLIGGLNVQAIFRNNVKGTHEHLEQFATGAVLLPEDTTITIPKQPVLGGVGGNPFIWVQILDGRGRALTEEIFLGRCVQGVMPIAPRFYMDALASVDVHLECANNPGPFITVNGGLILSGLKARFIFRNNDNPVGGPHRADATVEALLLPAGTAIKFPKQPVLGGVGGNPWIWLQFLYPDGEPASEEFFIGRCVQSSK